jgi:hypothetical protein
MGCPLRKLHHSHSLPPSGPEICNIRTNPPDDMEAQGFVSKNDQVEKADRKKAVALSA